MLAMILRADRRYAFPLPMSPAFPICPYLSLLPSLKLSGLVIATLQWPTCKESARKS